MHSYGWIVRTTLNIKDSLIEKASKLIGIKEKTTIVRLGLKALIARESNIRLLQSGRAEKNLKNIPHHIPA